MLTAVIDVGSNTIRILIGYVKDNKVYRIFSDRTVTRLSEGLLETGYLKGDNMESSVNVMRRASEIISKYGVKVIKAVGTEALRRARNNLDFIERVFTETGIKIKIIIEEEEAGLTLKGVLSGLEVSGGSLIMDIGGGSTEWIIYDAEYPHESDFGSMPIGVVNLSEGYLREDPPSKNELMALDSVIEDHIEELRNRGVSTGDLKAFVGTGGTVTTLASIDLCLNDYKPDLVHGHRLGLKRLKDIRDELLSMPVSQRKSIKGLEPERADLIIPGIILTIKIMDIFNFDELIVSDYGLLEGLLLEGGGNEKGL